MDAALLRDEFLVCSAIGGDATERTASVLLNIHAAPMPLHRPHHNRDPSLTHDSSLVLHVVSSKVPLFFFPARDVRRSDFDTHVWHASIGEMMMMTR